MEALDLGILEVIAQNARISDAGIGRALRISEDAVRYRLDAMERSKLIRNYQLFIDSRVLGFTRYHLLIALQPGKRSIKGIGEKVSQQPFVMWVNSFVGQYDLQVIIDAADAHHLNQICQKLFKACQGRIRDYIVLTCLHDLEFTNLNPTFEKGLKFERKADASFADILTKRSFPAGPKFKQFQPNRLEIQILRVLAEDPRMALVDIGRRLDCDRQTVRSRVRGLIKAGVITNIGAVVDTARMGYVTYYLLIRLDHRASEVALGETFHKLKNIFYAGRVIGDYDLIVYLNARTPQELASSMATLRGVIGNNIAEMNLLVQEELYFWRHFTEGIEGWLT